MRHNTERSCVPFPQILPVIRSCKTMVQYHTLDTDTDTVKIRSPPVTTDPSCGPFKATPISLSSAPPSSPLTPGLICSHFQDFVISRMLYKENAICNLWDWLYSTQRLTSRFIQVVSHRDSCSFVLLSRIPVMWKYHICWNTWVVSTFGYYKQSCYKHLYTHFYMNINFQFFEINAHESYWLIWRWHVYCFKKWPNDAPEWL